ncbi:hypothetical protein K458DRAFT_430185 [Lentithecium fluviatile CBS 122367]|uniref:Transcription factor Iwr1 domain-containing protein n=1 Tax=Lentithecium fluviatile CBS 122367 TaxID=1168545 RepID=A0A6G1J742_9PLEO|nr:hypothetical protein K458DRAFT_430185 [Lentithecium fluviatile CBS 122367]
MPPNPPQTLSVKRKRTEQPVGSLVVEHSEKRQKSEKSEKSGRFAWRLVHKPDHPIPPSLPSPVPQPNQRFILSTTTGERVLVPHPSHAPRTTAGETNAESVAETRVPRAPSAAAPDTARPRKRPGAGTAPHGVKPVAAAKTAHGAGPPEDVVRRFEQFSAEVEEDELERSRSGSRPPASPTKFKPRVPALRYKDRHPEKAAVLAEHDPDAMDLDDYVYDTYVREVIVPDANGKIPEPQGTVGIIVLNEEDEEFWNGDNESDREFATDDEDENAEEYYANDYPEDEMSSDDEYDRNFYKPSHRKGSDEEYDLNDSSDDDAGARSDGDEDDEHFRRVAPLTAPGYWGRPGE